MIAICKKCESMIPELELSEERKLELYRYLNSNSKMLAAKLLKDNLAFSAEEAKIALLHMNGQFGQCIRCTYKDLDKECMDCPKCKTFNYNLKGPNC